ncbi:hypothetical protein RRF57_005003 [Xylaria bambusicola]|uniref:deuterolysin n=1 Tax=Xylaria bambusicola TaxID=326684 RepID=A0AAN7Z7B8_9PEZI
MVSKGPLQYAKAGSTQIIGSVLYSSNLLSATVDGVAASKVFKAYHAKVKRQAVQGDCSAPQASATSEAINTCAKLAAEAASAAESDDEKLAEYSKDADSSTHSTVVSVFNAAASEYSSTSSGAPYYCSDVYDACEPGVIA